MKWLDKFLGKNKPVKNEFYKIVMEFSDEKLLACANKYNSQVYYNEMTRRIFNEMLRVNLYDEFENLDSEF